MEDLEQGKFKIEAYRGVALSDDYGRYYDGDYDPQEAIFAIGSDNEKDLSLVEFKNINRTFDEFEVTQTAENTTEEEVLELVNSNKKWFDELIIYKINNPDFNGDM